MTDAHKTKPQGRDELTASRHRKGDARADWRGVSDFQKARARLLALSRTAAKVQSVLEPHRVFETIGNELRDLGLTCFFGLLSDPGDTVRLRYTNFSPEVQKAMETLRRAPTGDFGIHVDTSPHFKAVVRNGEAVFERDPSKILAEVLAPVLKGSSAELTRLTESGGAISAPLVTGREILGVLTVWSDDLAEEDVPAVSVFAQQAAMAIENAGLYQEEMRRVFEMEALRKTTLDITRQLDVPQLLRSIVERASSLVGTKGGALYLHDPEKEELELVVSHLLGEDYAGTRLKVGEGLSGRVVLTGEPLIVQDYSSWEGRSEKYVDAPFKAVMGVPLKWGDKIIGVVNVTDVGQPRTFSDRDLRLLESFANQAAIAIENARAYALMERRVTELTALREISLQLTQSLDLSTVLDTIANSAVKLVNASDAHIFLYDQEKGEFTFGTGVWAPGQEGPVYEHVRKNGLTATVARRGEPVVLNEARTDPLFQDQESHGGVLEAIAGFPLKRADRVLGVFNVAFLQPHRFDQEELRVLTLLADQAAIAIDNARLYEETTERLSELATLHQTAVAATSTVDLAEVLERIIGTLERRLGFTNLALMLLDEKDQRLKIRAGTGYAPEVVDRIQPLLGEGITGTVALTGEPLNIPDVDADPRYIRGDEDVKSELCVPLEVGGRVIGVFNVESVEPAAFADDDLRLLSTLAGQLAVIIENARLYQETDRRLRESETLQEVSRLVNSSLEPDQIFQTVVETLASAFGYSMVSIYMMDGEGLRLGTEVGYGPAHAVDFIPLDKGVIGRVARTGEAELLYDVTQDPDYLEAAPGVVSEIAVPVMRDSQVLGVLNVESTAEEPLTVPDLRLVSSLSHQVSVAIQNAQLYQAAQRELAERKRAEEAYRAVVDHSLQGLAIFEEGKIVFANLALVDITGYSIDELLSLGQEEVQELVHAEDRALVWGRLAVRLAGEPVPSHYECRMIRKDGRVLWLDLYANIVEYQGRPAVQAAVVDVTDRKRAEEELRESEERFRTLFEDSRDAVYITTWDGRFVEANQSLLDLFGYTREELADISAAQFYADSGSRGAFQREIEQRGAVRDYEVKMRKKDGREMDCLLTTTLLPGEDGSILGYQGVIRDITERKRAEEALRESEEQFRSLAERSPNMIFINKKGKVLYANQKCEEIMGYTREQFYSADFDFFTLVAPECIDLVAGSFDKHSKGEDVSAYEYTLVTEQGKRIEAILATSLISYGGESAILGIVTDITERKRSEEELQRSYDRLQTTLEGTVNALAALAEARDPYTAGHQQRVAHLGCAIAEEMAVSQEEILGLRMAGLVHDIGKIYVPAEILSKPADLTAIEMQMIKTHPQTAHNILKEVEFPWAVAHIVLQHHERMDGSGYPQGLPGAEILVEARILAVADVIEAMVSHRPYRPAHAMGEAFEEISQHRGTLYDADVVDACLKLFRERGFELQRA